MNDINASAGNFDVSLDDLETKRFVASTSISMARVFKTEEEAKTWYGEKRLEIEAMGLTIFEHNPDDPWSIKPVDKTEQGDWVGYIDAENTEWEDNATTS